MTDDQSNATESGTSTEAAAPAEPAAQPATSSPASTATSSTDSTSAAGTETTLEKVKDTVEEELGAGVHLRIESVSNGKYIVQQRGHPAATVTKADLAEHIQGLLGA